MAAGRVFIFFYLIAVYMRFLNSFVAVFSGPVFTVRSNKLTSGAYIFAFVHFVTFIVVIVIGACIIVHGISMDINSPIIYTSGDN